MHKDLVLLIIAAVFGLGATLAAMALPSRYPNTPAWVWHWMFWGGVILMIMMAADIVWLWLQRPSLKTAALVNAGMLFLGLGVVSVFDDLGAPGAPPRPLRRLIAYGKLDLAAQCRFASQFCLARAAPCNVFSLDITMRSVSNCAA
jgi:hypothetical protein